MNSFQSKTNVTAVYFEFDGTMSILREQMKSVFVKIFFVCFVLSFSVMVWYSLKWTIEARDELTKFDAGENEVKEFKSKYQAVRENSLEKYVVKEKPEEERVRVDVYYESLSSDSYVFIKDQLKNVVDRLSNQVRVEFFPFGKSNFLTKGQSTEFYCHHGPKECQGNRYHACILARSKNQIQQTNMVLCMLKRGFAQSMETAAEICCTSFGMNFLDVRECATNQEGTSLLAKHGKFTKAVDVQFVPTITVDGFIGHTDFQKRMLTNFKTVICGILENKKGDKLNEFCRMDAEDADYEKIF